MAIVTMEALYARRYTTYSNTISDLGATDGPHTFSREPAHSLYVAIAILAGVSILVAAFYLGRAGTSRLFLGALVCMGVGTAGIGAYPQDHGRVHATFALCGVVGGAVAAILTTRVVRGWFSHVATTLGLLAVLAVLLELPGVKGLGGVEAELGVGGIERWGVYPVILWLFGFGVTLLGQREIRRR